MDQVALQLDGTGDWVYLGGNAEAKRPLEVVLRAFDHGVDFVAGSSDASPDGEPLSVPAGEGRRLEGRHFFVRSTQTGRISYRGM